MNQSESLIGVVKSVLSWRKPILLVTALAVIGTAVISLFLPNYYEAKTVFYAASSDRLRPELLYSNDISIPLYGNQNDIDRLLSIGESRDLVDFVIDSFKLFEHYNITPDNERARYNLEQTFLSHYTIKKNKLDAIEIIFEDKDKAFAAKVANTIRERINSTAVNLIKGQQMSVINEYEQDMTEKERQVLSIADTLVGLRRSFGLYNTVAQSESLTEQVSETEAYLNRDIARLEYLKSQSGVPRDSIIFISAMVKGRQLALDTLRVRLSRFNEGIGLINFYERQYYDGNQLVSDTKDKIKQWSAALNTGVSLIIPFEEAMPPLIKSRPKRSMLVVVAGFLAFVLSLVFVLLLEMYRELNWKELFTPTPKA